MPDEPLTEEEIKKQEEARLIAELCADEPRQRTATREDDLAHVRGHR